MTKLSQGKNSDFQDRISIQRSGKWKWFSIEILKMWAFGGLNENKKPVRSSK
jgi:hypothetical protein